MSQMDAASLSETALRGTLWTTLQTILNKLAVVAATIVLARNLTPDDYGDAFNATTIGAFAFLLAPWVLNDLLVSHPRRFDEFAGPALKIGLGTALVFAIALVAVSPLIQRKHYPDSAHFVFLIAVAAARPIADALMAVPWARLRIDLRFRSLAITDGTCQLIGTTAGVTMALMGSGPFAIVAPPVAVLFLQAAWYWMRARRTIRLTTAPHAMSAVRQAFVVAGLGQYLNNVVKILELLVLAGFAKTSQVGIFAFAFQLSTQANVIIANQLAAVIHPILSHINDVPERQVGGFMRALRLVACIGVPMSIAQGSVAAPLFALLFGDRWDGAVSVFAVLSIMQACIFVSTPIMTLLKSQGRFQAILVWQFVHIVLGGTMMIVALRWTDDTLTHLPAAIGLPSTMDTPPPLTVAMMSTIVWMIACPIVLCVAVRRRSITVPSLLQVLWQPWPISLGSSAILLLLPHWLPLEKTMASVVTLTVAAPLTLLAIVLACWSHPQSRDDLRALCSRLATRLPHTRSSDPDAPA